MEWLNRVVVLHVCCLCFRVPCLVNREIFMLMCLLPFVIASMLCFVFQARASHSHMGVQELRVAEICARHGAVHGRSMPPYEKVHSAALHLISWFWLKAFCVYSFSEVTSPNRHSPPQRTM